MIIGICTKKPKSAEFSLETIFILIVKARSLYLECKFFIGGLAQFQPKADPPLAEV